MKERGIRRRKRGGERKSWRKEIRAAREASEWKDEEKEKASSGRINQRNEGAIERKENKKTGKRRREKELDRKEIREARETSE